MDTKQTDAQLLLEKAMELNLMLAKQNSLIVQALTVPSLLVKADKENRDHEDN
jgi:hypothetical protein